MRHPPTLTPFDLQRMQLDWRMGVPKDGVIPGKQV